MGDPFLPLCVRMVLTYVHTERLDFIGENELASDSAHSVCSEAISPILSLAWLSSSSIPILAGVFFLHKHARVLHRYRHSTVVCM